LSDPEEPTIGVRDLTGILQSWIDAGAPEPPRLHKAGKAARRVAVYAHLEVTPWLERFAGFRDGVLEAEKCVACVASCGASVLARRRDRASGFEDGTIVHEMHPFGFADRILRNV
jgi:hypothetical protein